MESPWFSQVSGISVIKADLLTGGGVAALSRVLIYWFVNSAPSKAPRLARDQNLWLEPISGGVPFRLYWAINGTKNQYK